MSENSEHPPDDNEAETKAVEDVPNDSSKSEVKLMNRTDATMLEDEEMPTYISVSSTSRRDDSDAVNLKQQENMSQEMEEECSPSPYPSDDQAPSSVYVLSSEEDTDQHPYNDEDDEDEYGDSDDMENLELDNELDSEDPNNMRHLMDEEDDDEEDEDEKGLRQIHNNDDEEDEDEKGLRQIHNNDEEEDEDEKGLRQMHNNDDDTYDDNFDLYCDGRSDDFLLNRRIKNRDKEKSLSLQDLNMSKDKMEYIQRNSYNPYKKMINVAQFKNPYLYPVPYGKQPTPERYHHVQSKVKMYIKDIKEQNRRSMEKHMKQNHEEHMKQEDTIHNKNNTNHKNSNIKETKPTLTNKTIKDYAERTIKELEIAEACEGDKITYSTPIILNGQDNKNYLDSIHEESTQNEISPVKITQKQNGTVKDKQLKNNFPEEGIPHYGNAIQPSLIPNVHQGEPVLFNLHTLSSEEFKHGISNSSQKIDLNKNAHVTEQEHIQPETYNNAELMDMSIDNDTCPLKIENIKSIKTMTDELKNNNEQVSSGKVNEDFSKTALDTSEITVLKNRLDDVIEKKHRLFNAFREQVIENLILKGTIKELRESLAKCTNKPPEQKVASVQTDVIIDTAPEKHNETESTHVKQSNNKILGSSVASTLSSIDQWSDSAGNLSISMKPPEVAKTLHSDDSIVLTNDTPVKTTRSLSRTFITSSRILQTLSNITQGKTKLESPLVQNSKRRLSENIVIEQNDDCGCQIVNGSCRPSSSKKRKIDILEPSNLPCKASHTAIESHQKLNDTHNDSQPKHPCNLLNEKVESQKNSSNINTSQLETAASMTGEVPETTDDQEDNVKCFVYHENENSKDHSFLIIAKEPTKDKTVNEKRREGGPYIVGNIEVRMSEINGTINIWGKEISQESTFETENEIEISTKGIDDKKYHWQKTPHTRFNGSNLVCSTSKKCKTPPTFDLSSAVSNFSCAHSPSFNVAKASCSTDKAHVDNLHSSSTCVSCEEYELSKDRKEWLRYKQTHGQEKLHSCCIHHNADMLEQNCSLHKEKQKFEDNFNYSKEKLNTKEHRRSFSRNVEYNKHLHKNINSAIEEPTCKYHTTCHDTLHDPGETCQESHKCYNTLKETCTCEPLSMSTDRQCNESCNHLSPNVHEEEPLISSKQCKETPETRRRRLTGKRVRGILVDLLRGCGDCYNSNSSSNYTSKNKSCMHKKESCLTSCSPQIKISPCTSPEPSCSKPGQSVGRCCYAYAQRIESQLEEFRVEMERVRSRSDAILNMLNMLHSDTN